MADADERQAELAAEIGEEGTLASIQARTPKLRFNPETDSLKEEAPPEKEEKGEEETAEELAAREAREKEEKPPKQYRTKKAAEEAALEATRKMTEATTKAAEEKAAREAAEANAEALKQEAADLRKKLEEAAAAKPKTDEEKKAKEEADALSAAERRTALHGVTNAALKKIGSFTAPKWNPANAGDEEAEAAYEAAKDVYRDKISEAWAEAFEAAGITGMALSKVEMEKMVKETIKAEREAEKAADKEKNKAATDAEINTKAETLAKEGGLNMVPGSSDYNNFWFLAQNDLQKQDFMKGDKTPTLKEQVDWVVGKVKEIKAAEQADLEKEREKTRKTQARNTPLTKGMSPKPEKTDNNESSDHPSYSMAEMQAKIREEAKAKHRGV